MFLRPHLEPPPHLTLSISTPQQCCHISPIVQSIFKPFFSASGCISPRSRQPSNHDNQGVTHSREGVGTVCGLDGRNSSVGIETRESSVGFLGKSKRFFCWWISCGIMRPCWLLTFHERLTTQDLQGVNSYSSWCWLLRFWIRRLQAYHKRPLLFTSQHGVTVRNIRIFTNTLSEFHYARFSAFRKTLGLPPHRGGKITRREERLPTYISLSLKLKNAWSYTSNLLRLRWSKRSEFLHISSEVYT